MDYLKIPSYLLLTFLVLISLFSVRAKGSSPFDDPKYLISAFENFPVYKIDTTGSPVFGNVKAKVKLVEFTDFECPACKYKSEKLKETLLKFKGKISLYFINYPLDKKCNLTMTRDFHKHACDAAMYAYCAFKQGKFSEYHDMLFKNQSKLNESYLKETSKKIGLDSAKLNGCLRVDAKNKIKKDIKLGKRVEVEYTPTLFLNGKKVSDLVRTNDQLRVLIKFILKKK